MGILLGIAAWLWKGNVALGLVVGVAFSRPINALLGSNLFYDMEIVVNGTTGRTRLIQ